MFVGRTNEELLSPFAVQGKRVCPRDLVQANERFARRAVGGKGLTRKSEAEGRVTLILGPGLKSCNITVTLLYEKLGKEGKFGKTHISS